MELTKAQQNFLADLNLDAALAAGAGKVHFEFTHKNHIVTVEAYCSCDADIIVRRKDGAGVVSAPDGYLSLFDIPNTTNVSAEKVLRAVYEKALTPVDSQLKRAWLDTPYVELWHVSVQGACTEFSTDTEDARYNIEVTKSPEDGTATVAELSMSGAQIHTFIIPQPYPNAQTARSLLELAESITEAWREAVLE